MPLPLDTDFITNHNRLLDEERRRVGAILQDQAEYEKAGRNAKRVKKLQQKYPWLRPRVAAVFAQVKQPDEDVMRVFQNRWKDKGMATDPETLEGLEDFMASEDFMLQVGEQKTGRAGSLRERVGAARELGMELGGGSFLGRLGEAAGDVAGLPGEISARLPGGAKSGPGGRPPPDFGVSDVPGLRDASGAAKGALRAGFTGLESSYQEAQAYVTDELLKTAGTDIGLERAAMASESPYSSSGQISRRRGGRRLGVDVDVTGFRARSTGGIALGKLLRGEPVDSGTGILPSGELRDEQMRRARQAASIDGKAATPGRILASTVVEPGTKPYNALSGTIDAAMILGADPTNYALAGVGAARRAARTIRPDDVAANVGGFQGMARKFVDGPTAKEFLDSADGQKVTAYFANEDSVLRLNQRTNWKLPAELQSTIINNTDQGVVRSALEDALGVTVRETPNPFTTAAQRRVGQSRWSMLLPEQAVSIDRKEHMMQTLYKEMKHWGVADDVIERELRFTLGATGGAGQFESVRRVASVGEELLTARGIPRPEAREVMSLGRRDLGDTARQSFMDEIATQTAMGRQIDLGDAPIELSSAHLPVEHLNRESYLPRISEVDALKNKYGGLWGLPQGDKLRNAAAQSVTHLEGLQNAVWKPLVLLRGAWTVRVVGEEQLRMAAAGMSNVFTHPIAHIGAVMMLKNDEKLRSTPEFADALARRGRALYNDTGQRVVARGKRSVTWEEDGWAYGNARADQIITSNSDPLARQTAQAQLDGTLGDLKASFADGPLSKVRRDLAQNRANADALADGNRAGSDYFIDTVATRNNMLAGEDGRFLETIATGKYNVATVRTRPSQYGAEELVREVKVKPGGPRSVWGRDPMTVDKEFAATVRADGPSLFKQLPTDVVEHGPQKTRWWDKATDFLFASLGSYPTNYLSRSPAFTNSYWGEVERMFPYMDDAVRSQWIKRAHDAGTFKFMGKEFDPTGIHKRLNQAHIGAKGSPHAGTVGFEAADDLARSFALDSTKELLYDLNRKSKFFEATQLLFPFGEAWKEVLTRWAKLAADNPQIIRRGQVFIDGARESNPFELVPGAMVGPYSANGDPSAQGFFYKDGDTGEEVFTYPWTAAFTESQIGIPIPMVGRAQGLNMALQVMPGVGLAVQLPASWAMDRWMQDPKWDPVREIVFPFGEPETGPGNWLNIVAPPWMKKWLTSLAPWNPEVIPANEDARLLNNTIEDIAAYYISSGEFGPDQVAEAHEKAEDSARWLYRFRGSFQFGAPSAPSPRMVLEDEDGKLVRLSVARDAYYKLFEKDPSTATEKFIERFGEEWLYATAPKTISETYNAPVTEEALDWARENPGVVEKYPLVYGMFAPQGGEFDYTAYLRQLATGERQPVAAKDRWEGVNHMLGTIWYDRLREQMGLKKGETGNTRQRRELAQAEAVIVENYPGYKQRDIPSPRIPEAVKQLGLTTGDEALPEKTRAAVAQYLAERDAAIAAAERGGSVQRPNQPAVFSTAQRNAPIRAELARQARRIMKEEPSFSIFWERIFSRETEEPE